jgi:dCTP deaminase
VQSSKGDDWLSNSGPGVLPSQRLREAIDRGIIDAGDFKIPSSNIQPSSLDLRLGEVAYRIRCSFLPDDEPVEAKLKHFVLDEIDLRRDGAILETNRPYLIPLIEELNLPAHVGGKTNPKSSTGRLDVFTRVITDHSYRFDEVGRGYRGKLYLEVVPLSFTVKVRHRLALNQLRLSVGDTHLTDQEIRQVHQEEGGILFDGDILVSSDKLATSNGLFLSLDLRGDSAARVGYRARDYAPLLDMFQVRRYELLDYWEAANREEGNRLVLAPGRFYLLLSQESVRVPPGLAAEMTAYDPTSGELRTHYAGFFDPGFGHDPESRFHGSRAALEVRAHDVPFMIEHGQKVCKLTFERLMEPPDVLYGDSIGSSYQQQQESLSKHFVVRSREAGGQETPHRRVELQGDRLFSE